MSVTIKDVAKQAKVSVATVSRALNGHQNVTEAVRSRIVAVANELRYSPHHAARSLSSRRTHTIGVVLPDLYGEFFSELMRGIDQVARAHGRHLLVSSYHGNPQAQGAALRAMRGRVDGLLLMSPFVSGEGPLQDNPLQDSRLQENRLQDNLSPTMPVVLMNTRLADSRYPALCVDNHGGALAMTRHLIDTGRRRIAFIAGPEDNFDARERRRGYEDAIAEGLPGSAPWVLPGDFDEASGHAAAQRLLASGERPDAVFAANDMMALGCLFALNQAGVRVPQEIALAGFDDIPLARYVHPSLTTMRVEIASLGASAVTRLLEMEGGAAAAPSMAQLTPQLVVRASTRVDADAQAARGDRQEAREVAEG